MSELPVHVVANLIVEDAERYRLYEKGFFPLLKKHGGEFVTFDDKLETFEGDEPREGRMVILKFPSETAATAWYHDPEYQALSEHRRASTKLNFLTMVRSPPPRG